MTARSGAVRVGAVESNGKPRQSKRANALCGVPGLLRDGGDARAAETISMGHSKENPRQAQGMLAGFSAPYVRAVIPLIYRHSAAKRKCRAVGATRQVRCSRHLPEGGLRN